MAGIFPTLDRISISDDIGKFFSDEMVFNTFPQNLLQIPGKCQTFAEPAKSNYGSWIKFCMLLVKRFPFIPKPQSPFYQNQPKPKFVSSLLLRCQLARECHYKLHQDDNNQEGFKRLGKYSWSIINWAQSNFLYAQFFLLCCCYYCSCPSRSGLPALTTLTTLTILGLTGTFWFWYLVSKEMLRIVTFVWVKQPEWQRHKGRSQAGSEGQNLEVMARWTF